MDKQVTIVGRVDQVPKADSFGDSGYKVIKFRVGVS